MLLLHNNKHELSHLIEFVSLLAVMWPSIGRGGNPGSGET